MWKRIDDQLSLSRKHAKLSWQALGVWLYLLPNADGRGRFSADPEVIRSRCLTVRKDVRPLLVERAIQELSLVGLIHLYRVNDQAYLVLHDHDQWNPVKPGSIKPKWPDPPKDICSCMYVGSSFEPLSVREPDELQEESYTKEFLDFWNIYPRKIGKKKAFAAWESAVGRPSIERVKTSVETAMKSDQWRKEGGAYIPHPATWINQGRWDDDHEVKGIPRSGGASVDLRKAPGWVPQSDLDRARERDRRDEENARLRAAGGD